MDNTVNPKISFIFGGVSVERDLSLRTFHSIYSELQHQIRDTNLYQYVYYVTEEGFVIRKPFDFEKDPDYYMTSKKAPISIIEAFQHIKKNNEYVFSLLYGQFGEDGHIQGLGKIFDIKNSFGSVLSSSLTKSKFHCSKYIESMYPELEPIPMLSIRDANISHIKAKLLLFYNQEIVIKPNSLGTSMFTERMILNENSIDAAVNLIIDILKIDNIALLQKYIPGEEYSCGCIENLGSIEVLPLILVRTRNRFFGRREKLCKFGVSERIIPQSYNKFTTQIADISKRIFSDLMFENMFRLDFIVSEGKIYFLEVNSLPGLSHASFFPKMLKEINISMSDFIQLTFKNSLNRKNKTNQYNEEMDLRGAA
ncbi:ATP-grasp domain-containing protein [Legionella sp. PATHC038]|uniref:ATP-grasp domain-containing protein n=1 Tax=Legionella sheltonii TaxID=2992041 RepID=UPI0022433BD9|nr:ATP-grasp domain-containing protein [Legionella sp. PATHC038]MCW8397567.1 ATP-grasp domain-containing protein [Legionella sp. PATHC038]